MMTPVRLRIIKEGMMIRFIFITVVLMLILIVTGCFLTMTPEQRKETYDLRESVGNSQFVGDTSPEARYFADPQMYGPSR
jgi:predicted membrane protein